MTCLYVLSLRFFYLCPIIMASCPNKPFNQWQHSFHLKAVLPLVKELVRPLTKRLVRAWNYFRKRRPSLAENLDGCISQPLMYLREEVNNHYYHGGSFLGVHGHLKSCWSGSQSIYLQQVTLEYFEKKISHLLQLRIKDIRMRYMTIKIRQL